MCTIFLSFSGVSAEIDKKYDQFQNTLTVTSERNVQINDQTTLYVRLSKSYHMGEPNTFDKKTNTFRPLVLISFSVTGKQFYYFPNYMHFVIDGGLGEKTRFSKPDFRLLDSGRTFTIATITLKSPVYDRPAEKWFEAAMSGKQVLVQIPFTNQAPFVFSISPTTVSEWKEVLDFDLAKEVDKLQPKTP